ncbi:MULTISPECIES: YraN family protein [Marinomonas]|jgi:putative endonuclease|uniref:YraN family protein n=1 Tax=Marinomonas TaxID=28253 RepID=UPI001055F6D7|nr:YraN family protein [Marinomonas sp. KMM3893]
MPSVLNFFTRKKRNSPKNNGEKAEQAAELYLQQQGLRLIDRNFHSRMGEIDLIFLDNDTYVFVEVRFRANASHGSAAESLNPSKLKKVRLTADYWLQQNNKSTNACRFDAILFDQEIDTQHLTWLKAVF